MIVAVDARDGVVAVEGWTASGGVTAIELGRRAAGWGAAALLYTDVARDRSPPARTWRRPPSSRARRAAEVIASGGVSSLADLAALRDAGSRRSSSGARSTIAGSRWPRRRGLHTRCTRDAGALGSSRCLDVKDGRVVKGINFLALRDAGDPVEQAAATTRKGADEICYLDISASPEGRSTLVDVVARTADQVFAPLTVGGGVPSIADAERLLEAGADKIAVNTAAIRAPELVAACAARFSSQAIVVAVDAKRRPGISSDSGGWEVYSHGGRTPEGSTRSRGAAGSPSWAPASCS